MIKTSKIKYRRIMNELEYLYEEKELLEDIVSNAAGEFEVYYREYCARKNVDIDKLNGDNKERVAELYGIKEEQETQQPIPEYSGSAGMIKIDSSEDELDFELSEEELGVFKKLHEYFNKLFKKLALQLHPDRIENFTSDQEHKNKLALDFTKARAALDNKNYFKLIQIAKKYDIYVTENYSLQLKWFKKERDALLSSLSQIKSTYNYKFAECETEQEKDDLIRKFLWHLFRIQP